MKALAIWSKSKRVHLVRSAADEAHCGFRPQFGWRPVRAKADCPRCLAKLAAAIRALPSEGM